MLAGKQSWVFPKRPVIESSAAVGGPFEARGKLAADFDILHDDLWMGKDSYEKAHSLLMEEAIETAIQKANLTVDDLSFMLAGDLVNQLTPSSFAARTFGLPHFGLYGACSTSMEGLALASFIVDKQGAKRVVTGSSSHNAAIEKQFRYPTEYGSQKPPTAQWTVTGAGAVVVSDKQDKAGQIVTTSATIGKVVDMGLSDPFNMGGAMAPAAADTIVAHFKDLQQDPSYYDLIVTGDLASIGLPITLELLGKEGLNIDKQKFDDCGLMIYQEDQQVQAGGSGAGCSSVVMYGHLLNEMRKGRYERILFVATGALLSPLSYQQKESIPCIAHAVSVEVHP